MLYARKSQSQTIPCQRRISKLAGLGMCNVNTEGQGGGTTKAWKGPRGGRGLPSASDACTHCGWGPVPSISLSCLLQQENVHSFQTLETEHMTVTDSNYRLDPARGLDSKLSLCGKHTGSFFSPEFPEYSSSDWAGLPPKRVRLNCRPQTLPQSFLFSHTPQPCLSFFIKKKNGRGKRSNKTLGMGLLW